MRKGTPHVRSLPRILTMLEAVIADGGHATVSELARRAGIPVATAHRHVSTLVAENYLAPSGSGRHVAGSRLLNLMHKLDEKQVIVNVAAPILHRLAERVNAIVQLGTLESEMVTYRIKTGHGSGGLFTRVGMQLEAYCSGIGKVLLAHLPAAERKSYLAGGPFVPLTRKTIIEPARLAEELGRVRVQGFAIDNGEIAEGLSCLAVPIRNSESQVVAAISVSQADSAAGKPSQDELLEWLRDAAIDVETGAFGNASPIPAPA